MFKKEVWNEVYQSIKAHKLRTFLTGFGVAWGIFMLVLLLCVGKGFKNGVDNQLAGSASNTVEFWGGKTTIPYKGLNVGRSIQANSTDMIDLKADIPEIEYLSPDENVNNAGTVSYGTNSGVYDMKAVFPEFSNIEYLHIGEGRWLDPLDMNEDRKVVVISKKVEDQLFHGKNGIGEYITIKGNYYKVVGLVAEDTTRIFNFGGESSIYLPYSIYKDEFQPDGKIEHFTAVMRDGADAEVVAHKIKKWLSKKYLFDPKDEDALYVYNKANSQKVVEQLFSGVGIFLWIIGCSTLVGGVVGVGNIMLVTVKERTKEIGIRKALGAVPASIIALIMQEAIVITTVSGFMGLLFASGALSLIGSLTKSVTYFQHPQVDMNISISAIIILVIAGALAGFIPARNASKISPIEALRYE